MPSAAARRLLQLPCRVVLTIVCLVRWRLVALPFVGQVTFADGSTAPVVCRSRVVALGAAGGE